jgi:hypothetical protein
MNLKIESSVVVGSLIASESALFAMSTRMRSAAIYCQNYQVRLEFRLAILLPPIWGNAHYYQEPKTHFETFRVLTEGQHTGRFTFITLVG